ncbi:MAG: apolipoprotein N-acyltransferase [bacterium]|nr:apolipoprotein N-acyltransferase [bacterium]
MNTIRKNGGWMALVAYPVISGLVMGLAFPPLPLGFLVYVGLIPLFLSVERLRGRAAFGAGFLQGLVFYGITLYWISWITPPGALGAAVYMALFRGVFVWALGAIERRFGTVGLWAAPVVWVGLEYFNSLGDMGFPWVVLGNSQTAYLPLIQYADITGVYGVSFWVVVVNLAVLTLLRRQVRPALAGLLLLVLFAAPALHGLLALSRQVEGETLAVGVVQPNIAPVAKESRGFEYNYEILKPLTEQAVREGARLVVWPETAATGDLQKEIHRSYRDQIQHLADSLNVFLYTGAWHLEEGPPVRSFNSSFLFSPGKKNLVRYDKMHLVPFGERPPFPELLPFLREIEFSGGGFVSGNFDAGKVRTVFSGPEDVAFSGVICFDSVFPDLVREFVARGAQVLVVITNDGWFGRTSGPYQHAEASVFRAIENRRAVVRCANTGVSTFIDPYGRKSQTTGIFHSAVLTGQVAVRSDLTFYSRYGDLFSKLCLVLAVLLLAASFYKGRSEQASTKPPEPSILPTPAKGSVPVSWGTDEGAPIEELAMPFLDHLEELRWRILKGLVAVAVGALICGTFSTEILNLLKQPIQNVKFPLKLIYLKPMGMFMVKLNIALVGGVVLALPVLLYQLWLFVVPGLFINERKYVSFIIFSSTVCFLLGAMVAYFGVVPLSLAFLAGMGEGTEVEAQWDIGSYIGFVLRLLVAFGAVFELPVATFFLTKVGVLTVERMRAGRRYALVGIFILAALLTPPDPISQLMMAVPMLVLYEISIWVSRIAAR